MDLPQCPKCESLDVVKYDSNMRVHAFMCKEKDCDTKWTKTHTLGNVLSFGGALVTIAALIHIGGGSNGGDGNGGGGYPS